MSMYFNHLSRNIYVRAFTTAIFLLFINNVNGQHFTQYYQLINNAEIALTDSNWYKASQYYDQAFSIIETPYSKDLQNATICILEQPNVDERLVQYCKKLFQLGIDIKHFDHERFSALRKNKLWTQIKDVEFKNARKTYQYNQSLRKEVEKRFKKDQLANDPKRVQYFHENIVWLKDLILKDNFPNEKRIGTFTNTDLGITHFSQLEMFILHWSEHDKKDSLNLIPLYLSLIKKGELHPTVLALTHYDLQDVRYSKWNNCAYIFSGEKVLSPTFNEEELKVINTHREKLGLNNFSNYQKIVRFAYKDQRFIFNTARICEVSSSLSKYFLQQGYILSSDIIIKSDKQ